MGELQANLYDINKNIVSSESVLSKKEIREQIKEYIIPFIKQYSDKYFMLLCRERYDFTLFNFKDKFPSTIESSTQDFFECFINRGSVASIYPTPNNDAIEIWLIIEEEAFAYYFFPYEAGVIEEGI